MASLQSGKVIAMHPAVYIGSWIFFSNITILFNKWLIDNAGFRYPVILTWWHMTFASLVTQLLARTTKLLDGRHNTVMTPRMYLRAVVPIGLLYSGSMVSSTLVYLYLSVPFIQMLKAAAPAATLFVGWIWGLEHPTWKTILNIAFIVFGVVMASAGEIHFSWPGFLYQVLGIFFESVRVIMIQHLMSESGLKMDPLVSLYYYAPVCAITNLLISLIFGWSSAEWTHAEEVGFGMLLVNALVAFLMNISSVFLIGKTSGLVLILAGILKNIILVTAAVAIWGTPITPLQLAGYSIALLGLFLYQSSWRELLATIKWPENRALRRLFSSTRKPFLCIAAVMASLLLVLAWTREERVYGTFTSVQDTVTEADKLSMIWLTWIHVRECKWWVGTG
ncbi:TPT-domain-containing protein [Xylariaceae sp. FL0016]|nr:TPT-domain-containing protein [Xylariaceae sp. FL0016]